MKPDNRIDFRIPFPVEITGKTDDSGTWLYSWKEKVISAAGSLTDANPGRVGSEDASPAYELNNRSVDTGTIVWLRLRGELMGEPVYEFFSGSGSAEPEETEISEDTDDLPVGTGVDLVFLDVIDDYSLTGIDDGYPGRELTLYNTGDGYLSLPDGSTDSAVGNRFDFPSSIALPPGQSLSLVYEGDAGSGAWVLAQPLPPYASTPSTNTVVDAFTVSTTTTGTAAAGLGVAIPYEVEDASGNHDTIARTSAVLTNATDTSEASDYVFETYRAGTLTEQARFTSSGALRLQEISTPATPASGTALIYVKADGSVYVLDDAGTETQLGSGGSVGTEYLGWVKITKTYTDLSAASAANDIEAYSLPAKGHVQMAVLKHTQQFSGGTLSGYNVTLGVTGPNYSDYVSTYNAIGAPGDTTFNSSAGGLALPRVHDFGSAKSVRIRATSTGANLNAATQGSVDIYLLVSILP